MTNKTQGNGGFRRVGWVIGGLSLLFIVGAGGLEFFVQQAFRQASVATILLALYVASLLYVVGLVGMVVLTVWWVLRWSRVRAKPAAMGPYSPAEPRSRGLDKPQLEDPQFPQQSVAPVVPSLLPSDRDDRNKATTPSRVA